MALMDLCEKYYKTTNLYEVLQIDEKATATEVIKAYMNLSRKFHPDHAPEDQKQEATEKYVVLGSVVHSILTNIRYYPCDETKTADDNDFDTDTDADWQAYLGMFYNRNAAYEKEYIGSEEEKIDIKRAYLKGRGDMEYIVDQARFPTSSRLEERQREILNVMIRNGELPIYEEFTNEPAEKRQRRLAKEKEKAKETEEFESVLKLEAEQLDEWIFDELGAKQYRG